jgi:allantoin racemase
MRVRNIIANCRPEAMLKQLAEHRASSAGPQTVLETVGLPAGPISLETGVEEAMASPYVVDRAVEAEALGFDAVTLDCFSDPALRAAREAVRIPVVGPGLAGILFASALGDEFSILVAKNGVRTIRDTVRRYGFQNRVASIRTVDFHLHTLLEEWDRVYERLYEEARAALSDDGADLILLGCTGMSQYAPVLMQALDVPVVDPWACAVKMATALVEMGLTHSSIAYPPQPESRQITR